MASGTFSMRDPQMRGHMCQQLARTSFQGLYSVYVGGGCHTVFVGRDREVAHRKHPSCWVLVAVRLGTTVRMWSDSLHETQWGQGETR